MNLAATDGTALQFNTFWGVGGMGSTVVAANNGMTLLQESNTPWKDDAKHFTLMGRLDYTINESHRAALRLNTQVYKGVNDIYGGTINNKVAESNNSSIKYATASYVLELSSVFSSSLLNEFRFQNSSEDRPENPNSNVSPAIGLPGFTAGNYYIDPRNTIEKTNQIIDNLTYMNGDWVINAGVDFQDLKYSNTFFQYGRGAWYFKNWDAANQWFAGSYNNPGTIQYQQAWSNTDGKVDFGEKIMATYLGARYSGFLNKRLTLTMGLRYTREMYEDNPSPNPKVQGLDHMPDNGSLDPRVGFALDLFGNNRTVLRGGFGLFSATNPAQNVASSFLQNGQNSLPYKISWSAATSDLFSPGGLLSANQRINANHNITAVDPSLLSTLPSGTIAVTLMDPNARMSQSRNALLGIEHDFGNGYSFKARGVYKKFTHLQYFVDINMGQVVPGTTSTNTGVFYNDGYPYRTNLFTNASGSPAENRPGHAIVRGRSLDLSGYGSVGLSKFDGEGSYKALILEFEKRSATGFGFMTNLTFSQSRDTNSNERNTAQSAASNPIDPANPLVQARGDNDIPVRGVFMGYLPTVWGIKSSFVFIYTSGYVFTPRYYADVNNDGYLNDPYQGRNSMRQPYSKTLNLKIARSFKLAGSARLSATMEIYNLPNWANQTSGRTTYDTASGIPTTDFRMITNTDKKSREVQFTLKATF